MAKRKRKKERSLDVLYAQRAAIEHQILLKKKEIAIKEGRVFASVDDLVCEHNPGAKFMKDGEIPGAEFWEMPGRGERGLNIYVCGECKHHHDISLSPIRAYDCPNCGIVKGEPSQRPYDDIEILSGSKGNLYSCTNCGTELSRHAIEMS